MQTAFISPPFSEALAVAMELPVILAIAWITSRWLTKQLVVPASIIPCAGMGTVASALLMAGEFTISLLLAGRTPAEHLQLYGESSRAWLLAMIMAAAGLAIGLDSRPDGISPREIWLAQTGTAIGGVLLLNYVGGIAVSLTRPWQRTAIRAAGSWAAASAVIVLSPNLFGPGATG